ncbi:NUDIX domain-containing protein [uncultured Brevibacillus sp.]|uniref:NUDIX hydrolase n=1 Tax=uncultured Brevibacillus sp. TaxID=169970 RepID=UPI0025960E8B|nr:NUDIX domain-containing protein [uncultured Brevibacillus sp.]
MQEEQLDIFDEAGQHIGVEARSEVHRLGLWHQTFHCWIYRVVEGQVEVLFQKRHPQKDTCPNLLDITSAGHLLASEQPSEGVRELYEELGLSVRFEQLSEIGMIRDVMSSPGIIDKEMCHTFMFACEQPLDEYVLQQEEVTGLLWVRLVPLEQLFAGELTEVTAAGFLVDEKGKAADTECKVSQADFVPHEAHYYEQVFMAIKRQAVLD